MSDTSINSADWLAYVAFCAWVGYPTGSDAAVAAWQKARTETTSAAWTRVANAVASQVSTSGHGRSHANRLRLEPSEQETRLACEYAASAAQSHALDGSEAYQIRFEDARDDLRAGMTAASRAAATSAKAEEG